MAINTVKIAAQWQQVKQHLPRQEMVRWVLQRISEPTAVSIGEVVSTFLDLHCRQCDGAGRWEQQLWAPLQRLVRDWSQVVVS